MRVDISKPLKSIDSDVAQVCENGHVVNWFSDEFSSHNRGFCPECGKKTQTQCSQCNDPIEGGILHLGLIDPDSMRDRNNLKQQIIGWDDGKSIPEHCGKCGQAFPWAGKALNTKKQKQSNSPLGSFAVVGNGNTIQFQSPNSSQAASVSILQIEETIKRLNELVRECPANELDKEDATAALERIRQLAEKPKNAEVFARANEKLELVKNTIGTAVELGKIAVPYIAILANHFA
jgi:Uncharacterized protein conserved in bacteria (DUF2321)